MTIKQSEPSLEDRFYEEIASEKFYVKTSDYDLVLAKQLEIVELKDRIKLYEKLIRMTLDALHEHPDHQQYARLNPMEVEGLKYYYFTKF